MDKYAKQHRGSLSAYEEYFAGMDASMQQKIALTTAHFPSRGKIADMGSGSGSGTFDLARLYENLEVAGVDINPVTVEYSNSHYKAANLKFITGDIADKVFENESLDGILNSSVLHHVTSFNGFDKNQIVRALNNQVAQLKKGGVIIIRDFVVPNNGEKEVFLDLPNDDGKEEGEIPELSSAALFKVFAKNFRSSLVGDSGVIYEELPSIRDNFSRFKLGLRNAAEFILRKDYRDHWDAELLEEYCYYSQAEFESNFELNDLRIVVSMPLWNPWIVEKRFEGKFYLSDNNGKSIHFPPTNFLIAGEKIGAEEGYRILECGPPESEGSFLKLKAYKNKESGQIFELAERPNKTIDLLPWYQEEDGQIFILAKKDFPRPVINAARDQSHLNRANYSGYLTEPISAIVSNEDRDSEIAEILKERANLKASDIIGKSGAAHYFTSPGGIDECVESYLVNISNWEKEPHIIENYTPFISAGSVRELDALQVLRASHVGGMFDARLEINIYRLLRKLNRSASSWIGAAIKPGNQKCQIKIENEIKTTARQLFEPIELEEAKFLKIERSEFIEYDSCGDHLKKADFEYALPREFSKNTAAAIPFIMQDSEIYIGIEYRDLPAAQSFTGSSQIVCVPAWRLPKSIGHKFDIAPFLKDGFAKDFGIGIRKQWELGGSYFTSAGITPEVVYPFAIEIDADSLAKTDLRFYRLENLLAQIKMIRDAHLLILLNRLAHAFGRFSAK